MILAGLLLFMAAIYVVGAYVASRPGYVERRTDPRTRALVGYGLAAILVLAALEILRLQP